jgi:hypothetical protein
MTVMVVACAGIATAQTNARQIVSMPLLFTWRLGETEFYNSHSDESNQKAKSVGQVCATGAAECRSPGFNHEQTLMSSMERTCCATDQQDFLFVYPLIPPTR